MGLRASLAVLIGFSSECSLPNDHESQSSLMVRWIWTGEGKDETDYATSVDPTLTLLSADLNLEHVQDAPVPHSMHGIHSHMYR